jgi:hypothetical protein
MGNYNEIMKFKIINYSLKNEIKVKNKYFSLKIFCFRKQKIPVGIKYIALMSLEAKALMFKRALYLRGM